ncbi:HugZ family protein [Pseudotabrizicola formosa]|uniref:HugZ family pyridoxamine 5'-phosphate oxidase n=1 Tax=Pseudotabrizicola formosa TaxID=2030009 RepID=UPI000CD32990|nr:pyridoxamine 5-phosphate oxidase [Pseudotabrizicola formosa]
MATRPDPVLPADDAARALSRDLLAATHAALSYLEPETALPAISRIAFGLDPAGVPMTLISALAPHSAALRANPACALLLGEPGPKGDPLTHPRLMLQARAQFIAPDDPNRPTLRDHWLAHHPKSKLYIDFADFSLVRLHPVSALLNGGFGRAFRLSPADLT